jgi:hypothetical protein
MLITIYSTKTLLLILFFTFFSQLLLAYITESPKNNIYWDVKTSQWECMYHRKPEVYSRRLKQGQKEKFGLVE